MRKTTHYNLTMFTEGDNYLSSADKSRFSIIDNQLHFLASQIGDGVISGWEIEDIGSNTIKVKEGFGVIDDFATSTYGRYTFQLENNKRYYFYIKRKPDIRLDRSAFSPMSYVSYTDATPPATPSAPVASETAYNYIQLTWTANTEVDLDYYELWRSTDNITFSNIATLTTNSYKDEDVLQNTTYYYKLISYDENGLTTGSFSSVLSTATDLDTRVPSDPVSVDVVNGDQTLQVIWDAGANLVDSYHIIVQPVDTEGANDGIASEYDVPNTVFMLFVENLTNGQNYQITVKSVSATGIESDGVVVNGLPVSTSGAQQIVDFTWSDFAVDSSWNVGIDLSWTTQSDSYMPAPSYYVVTIVRDNEVGDPTIYLEDSITINRYTVAGDERVIYENTKYTIKVQTATADGVLSEAYILRIKTTKFSSPGPVKNVTISYTFTPVKKELSVVWKNTNTEFSYNTLTIKRTPISNPSSSSSSSVAYILQDYNFGQAEKYNVAKSEILNNCIYTVIIKTYDFAGNVSEDAGSSAIINEVFLPTVIPGVGETDSNRPLAVSDASSISGNDMVTLYWSPVISDNLDKYCVWRSPYTIGYFNSETFEKLIELDSSITKYTDYDVSNGEQYVYFITTKDIYGVESLNPTDDDYISYNYVTGEPRNSASSLTAPPAISTSVSGNDVVISWEPDSEPFDGYEIYKSIANKASFVKIDVIDNFSIGYVDVSGLHKSGNYYYMLRKFREEAEVIYTENVNSAPLGALLIGTVIVANNVVTIDNSVKYNLVLLEDPIIEETQRQFSVPTHLYYNTGDDRRIRLSDKLIVSNWTTENYKEYTTESDIRGTTDYVIYIGDTQSTYDAYIDKDTGILYFEDFILDAATITDENPAPVITVIFLDTGEVTGILPVENIGDIIADKVSKSKVSEESLKQIDHFGRFREECVPTKYDATRVNGNTYETTTPAGVTFYDMLLSSADQIVAATNEGVRVSEISDGTQWDLTLSSPLLCSKVFYSTQYDWYFALCVDKVYYTENLIDWFEINGITGANFIQDIVEDDSGNIFVSSDAGIYRLNPNEFIKLQWQQVEPISLLNNSSYALLWHDNKLHVSVESGVYTSTDLGETWEQLSALQVPLFSLIYADNALFGCSNNKVWRKKDSESSFTVLDTFTFSVRKIAYFSGDLYITTDMGLFRSDPLADVLVDTNVKFDIAFSSLNRNGFMPCAYALKNIGSRLYIGMDERIHSITSRRKIYTHSEVPGINPIIYINGIERNVGVFFSLKNKIVTDYRLLPTETVQIVRDYTIFNAVNGGWADSKYDAECTLVINGSDQSPAVKPATDATTVAAKLTAIVTPFFNARTSNFDEAMKYLKLIVQSVDAIDTIALLTPSEAIPSSSISQIFSYINMFKVNVNPSIRDTVVLPSITAGTTTTSGYTFEVDVVSGKLTITTGVTKYTRVQLSIKEVGITGIGEYSHREIEDTLELVNSGLSASLASVQQSNIIKMGIHDQLIDPLGLEVDGLTYQSKFFAGCDPWYDPFESTLDYKLETEQNPNLNSYGSFSINYPSDVLYESSTLMVWVCGQGGIIGVNATTYETVKIFQHDAYFFNMHQSGDEIYTLSDDGLYTVNINTYEVVKQVDADILEGASSVLRFGDATYLCTKTGLYYKKDNDLNWKLLFEINDAFVRASQKITFCAGQNPEQTSVVGEVYYSTGGVTWNRSNQFEDILISGVTQRYDSVYYATNKGIIVEDLSGLFSGREVTITAVDLDGDDVADEVVINAIDSDDEKVIAATPDGTYYQLSGNTVITYGQSKLSAVHKVKVVGGKYWLFADNLIDIEGVDRFIQLSTGKALI